MPIYVSAVGVPTVPLTSSALTVSHATILGGITARRPSARTPRSTSARIVCPRPRRSAVIGSSCWTLSPTGQPAVPAGGTHLLTTALVSTAVWSVAHVKPSPHCRGGHTSLCCPLLVRRVTQLLAAAPMPRKYSSTAVSGNLNTSPSVDILGQVIDTFCWRLRHEFVMQSLHLGTNVCRFNS